MCGPIFFACLEREKQDPDRGGHRLKIGQSSDLIVDRWEIGLAASNELEQRPVPG
jgi:hypothetical protein